jgi:hypothetical protein
MSNDKHILNLYILYLVLHALRNIFFYTHSLFLVTLFLISIIFIFLV